MTRLIDADALKRKFAAERGGLWAMFVVDSMPTVDAVPVGVIEQFKWERDTAIQQLEEHGIPFCGKADVAPIVRCKDCKKRGTDNCEREYYLYGGRSNNWYCASGERGEE